MSITILLNVHCYFIGITSENNNKYSNRYNSAHFNLTKFIQPLKFIKI